MNRAGKDDGRGSGVDLTLARAIDHLVGGGGPRVEGCGLEERSLESRSALESRLLSALEMAAGCTRATIWARSTGDGPGCQDPGGSPPWIHRRSRGPRTPSPAELPGAPWGARFRALDAGPLGTVVHALDSFDDGSREAREDALEALAALAGELLGDGDDAMGASPLDLTPPPFARPGGDEPGEAA